MADSEKSYYLNTLCFGVHIMYLLTLHYVPFIFIFILCIHYYKPDMEAKNCGIMQKRQMASCHKEIILHSIGLNSVEVSSFEYKHVYIGCPACCSLLLYKWKNRYSENDGGCRDVTSRKSREQEDAFTKTQTHS